MQVLEVKTTLAGQRKEYMCSLCLREPGHAVVLYRLARDAIVAGVDMPAGTVSFGHYWDHRSFNVYHRVRPSGETAAYYFNLADSTVIGEQTIEWRDLAVDVIVTPDGACRVLDEDELPENLDEALRAAICFSLRSPSSSPGWSSAPSTDCPTRCPSLWAARCWGSYPSSARS